MKVPWHSWPAAMGLLGLILFTELLPRVGGRGEAAHFDWSFTYVTLHFVLIPLAAAVHVLWNLADLVLVAKQPLRIQLAYLSSVFISLGYLVLLIFQPIFPWWGPGT